VSREGIIVAVAFVLEELGPAVRERADTWAALGLHQRALPVHPNHGKPVTSVEFESAVWLVEVTIWGSGEADLSTVRLTDDRVVNKHYELADRKDLDVLVFPVQGSDVPSSRASTGTILIHIVRCYLVDHRLGRTTATAAQSSSRRTCSLSRASAEAQSYVGKYRYSVGRRLPSPGCQLSSVHKSPPFACQGPSPCRVSWMS
jgi:hypothetical protein